TLLLWLNRSHLWIAMGGMCLTAGTFRAVGAPCDLYYLILAGTLVWLAYYFLKRNEWTWSTQWAALPLTLLILVGNSYLHWLWLVVIPPVLLYDLKWLTVWRGKWRGIRYSWWLKPLVIAGCWVCVTAVFPLVCLGQLQSGRTEIIAQLLFVLAMTWAGDLRDTEADQGNCRTLVQVAGPKIVLALIVLCVVGSFLMVAIRTQLPWVALEGVAMALIVYAILRYEKNWQRQTWWLDALLPARFLLMLLV
ncbi:MAG: hypothetical protein JNM00_07790, partial [Flavobacteriales bacterium]|nr:hypothetical protein [Flavobacteriales bacterium]